jgi:hypothetical protein
MHVSRSHGVGSAREVRIHLEVEGAAVIGAGAHAAAAWVHVGVVVPADLLRVAEYRVHGALAHYYVAHLFIRTDTHTNTHTDHRVGGTSEADAEAKDCTGTGCGV